MNVNTYSLFVEYSDHCVVLEDDALVMLLPKNECLRTVCVLEHDVILGVFD